MFVTFFGTRILGHTSSHFSPVSNITRRGAKDSSFSSGHQIKFVCNMHIYKYEYN
jgi:hypothetical protein